MHSIAKYLPLISLLTPVFVALLLTQISGRTVGILAGYSLAGLRPFLEMEAKFVPKGLGLLLLFVTLYLIVSLSLSPASSEPVRIGPSASPWS